MGRRKYPVGASYDGRAPFDVRAVRFGGGFAQRVELVAQFFERTGVQRFRQPIIIRAVGAAVEQVGSRPADALPRYGHRLRRNAVAGVDRKRSAVEGHGTAKRNVPANLLGYPYAERPGQQRDLSIGGRIGCRERLQRPVVVQDQHVVPLGRNVLYQPGLRGPAEGDDDQIGRADALQPMFLHASTNWRISARSSAALSDTRIRAVPLGTVG